MHVGHSGLAIGLDVALRWGSRRQAGYGHGENGPLGVGVHDRFEPHAEIRGDAIVDADAERADRLHRAGSGEHGVDGVAWR